ncbi:MAG: hypothetical protein WC316_04175, partial [Candidatus Omnitrophota bacterium]
IFTVINLAMAVLSFVAGSSAIKFVALFYGATIDLTPQMTHVIRMFGAMNLAMAFMGAAAMIDPGKNRAIINGAIILLLVRAIEMLVFYKDIVDNFNIAPSRLIFNSATFLVMAIALIVFRPKTQNN